MNKTLREKSYTALCCLFGTAALCALTARAGAVEDAPPTKTVKYDDLDITKPAGAKTLYRRIQAAAVEVCPVLMSRELELLPIEHRCIEQAIDAAVRSVNAPALTQLRAGGQVRLASK